MMTNRFLPLAITRIRQTVWKMFGKPKWLFSNKHGFIKFVKHNATAKKDSPMRFSNNIHGSSQDLSTNPTVRRELLLFLLQFDFLSPTSSSSISYSVTKFGAATFSASLSGKTR